MQRREARERARVLRVVELVVGAGLLVALPRGIQVFGNYRILLGHRYYDSQSATAGVRAEF